MRVSRKRSVARIGAIVTIAVIGVAGCADNGFEISPDGYTIPATIDEMLPLANQIAKEWDDEAYLYRIGGGVTVLDEDGRGYNHSFRYYSIRTELELHLDLFAGAQWADEVSRPRPQAPPPLFGTSVTPGVIDPDRLMPSDQAVRIAVRAIADSIVFNIGSWEALSVRLLSVPQWPERTQAGTETDSVAWRVDFIYRQFDPGEPPVWWSRYRVYMHPMIRGFIFEVVDDDQQYPTL